MADVPALIMAPSTIILFISCSMAQLTLLGIDIVLIIYIKTLSIMEIKEGSHVVIVDNSGNRRVLKVKAGRKIKHFKVMLDLGQLIGK